MRFLSGFRGRRIRVNGRNYNLKIKSVPLKIRKKRKPSLKEGITKVKSFTY